MSMTTISCVAAAARHPLGEEVDDRRMGQRVEIGERGRVGEHHRGESRPDDPPALTDDLLAEALDDRPVGEPARLEHLSRDRVRVDDRAAALRPRRRDGGLARPDPPGEPHEQHGIKVAKTRAPQRGVVSTEKFVEGQVR